MELGIHHYHHKNPSKPYHGCISSVHTLTTCCPEINFNIFLHIYAYISKFSLSVRLSKIYYALFVSLYVLHVLMPITLIYTA